MSGIASWQAEIKLDIEQLKSRLSEAEKELGNVTEKEHKVKLDIDTKTLDSAIKKLDKMLNSLGKGTGDFKQFENLGTQLESITSDVKSLSNAFSKIDDSKLQGFFSSIQNIDNTLDRLSNHILSVGQNMNKIGSDNGIKDAVKNTQNLTKANEEAAKSAEKLANAQKNITNKPNTSKGHFESGIPEKARKYQQSEVHTPVYDNSEIVKGKDNLGDALKRAQSQIIASLDKQSEFVKDVTDFYDSNNNLLKTQTKISDKYGNQRTYTTSYSERQDGDYNVWTSHIDTEKIQKEIEYEKKLAETKKKSRQDEKISTQDSVTKALKDQESAWKNIQSIREKISKTSDSEEIENLQQIKNGYREQYIEANKVLKANSDLYDKELQRSKLQQIKTDTDKRIAEPQEKEDKQARSKAKSYVESAQKKLKNAISKYSYGDTSEASAELEKLSKAWANFATKDNPNPTLEQVEARMKEIDNTIASIISKLKTDHTSNLNKINDEIKDEDKKDRKDKADKKKKTSDENASKWSTFNNDLNKTKKSEERRLQGKSFDDQVKSFEQLEQKLTDFHTQGIISEKQFTDAKNKIDGIKQHLKEMKDDIISKQNKSFVDDLEKSISKYRKEIDDKKENPTDINQNKDYKNLIENYSTIVDEIETLQSKIKNNNNIATEEDITKLNKLTKAAEDYSRQLKSIPAAEKGSTEESRVKLLDRISKYLKNNSNISEEAKVKLKGYLDLLSNGSADTHVKEIAIDFYRIADAERAAGREGKSLFSVIKDKIFYGAAASIASYFGLNDLIQYGRQAVSTIVELDTALVDLKKTTSMSSSELNTFYFDANNVAKQMGVTTKEIIDQASAWSRLGYSSKEASTEMAKLSSQFASISPGMSTDEAQEGLVSIMKAFDVNPEDVKTNIMDKINVLGNKFAENNQDVVEGLKRSSAAMAAMGQSFEDTAALFTGGMEILQDSESMGTALRSVAMRIRGYSEETGELDGELQNVTGDVLKLTKTAKDAQGVSIFTDATQKHYKSMIDYLGEIADRWNDISEQNQTEILSKLFAKTRAQAGAAILKNFSQVRKALVEMENSAGSSDKEMSAIESSLEYKINKLKETWVGTVQEMIDRGSLGKLVDGLTKLSEALGVLINKFGLIKTAAMAFSAVLTKNNVGRDKIHSLKINNLKDQYADNMHNLL